MFKKISVNGIEVSVNEDNLDKLVEMLKEGVVVDDLEGWQTKVRIFTQCLCTSQFQTNHEPYDFNKFIDKAKEYSDKNPPDVVQFRFVFNINYSSVFLVRKLGAPPPFA